MTNDIEHARTVRAQRAAILRALGDRDLNLVSLLRNPPTCLLECTLYDLVRSAHNMGPTGAEELCRMSRLSPLSKIGKLQPATIEVIISKLPKRAQ